MPTRRQYSLRVAPLSRYPFTNAAISSALRLRPMPLSQQHSRPTINRGCSDAYNHLAFAQRTNLVVDQAENAIGMACPIALRFSFRHKVTAPIADQHRVIPLPDSLQAEVVVDAAVGEDNLASERLALEVESGIRSECFWVEPDFNR